MEYIVEYIKRMVCLVLYVVFPKNARPCFKKFFYNQERGSRTAGGHCIDKVQKTTFFLLFCKIFAIMQIFIRMLHFSVNVEAAFRHLK